MIIVYNRKQIAVAGYWVWGVWVLAVLDVDMDMLFVVVCFGVIVLVKCLVLPVVGSAVLC